jgi:hypothetical protein
LEQDLLRIIAPQCRGLSQTASTLSGVGRNMNPFGVGHSGDDWIVRGDRCRCCQLPFQYRTLRTQPQFQTWCEHCADHYPEESEPQERRLRRLAEHEPRFLAYMKNARDAAKDAWDAVERQKAEAQELREQVRGALRSRDQWREILTAVALEHVEEAHSKCSCGLDYPCVTVDVLELHPGHAEWLRTAAWRDEDAPEEAASDV